MMPAELLLLSNSTNHGGGRLFTGDAPPRELVPGADVSLLLGVPPHLDTRA
jgi:hypothetical protein